MQKQWPKWKETAEIAEQSLELVNKAQSIRKV